MPTFYPAPLSLARLASLLLAAVLAAGCTAKSDPASPVPAGSREQGTLVLTHADHNRSADLRVAEPLMVQLPENPSTGYTWAIDETDRRLLTLDGTAYAHCH